MNAILNADRRREDRQRALDWLALHLSVTASTDRLSAVRKAIADRGLTDRALQRLNGREESYAHFCARYDIDLDPQGRS